ncbi:MAG: carotenoid biosynthesis protein [Leptospirales bacterium]
MSLFFHTILFRWYVFLFWGAGLVFLARAFGWWGAILRFVLAYLVAYLCEYSSSEPSGWFPFGHYVYLPTTLHEELWVGPLPLMDSLSFSFLMVASLGMVGWFERRPLIDLLGRPNRERLLRWAVATVFFVLIDVVIDPVSLRGNRWFLGQIYYYPEGGAYFGVPLSNFIGWGVVGVLILLLWTVPFSHSFLSVGKEGESSSSAPISPPFRMVDRWGPLFLYLSVFFFNLAVAFLIHEWLLAGADLLVGAFLSGIGWLFARRMRSRPQPVRLVR